jgi:hypothetical protein
MTTPTLLLALALVALVGLITRHEERALIGAPARKS